MRRREEFNAWVSLIGILLRRLKDQEWPFSPSFIYTPWPQPYENDNLNAKLDLERALNAGCKTPEEVVVFLRVVEEGWFFEWMLKWMLEKFEVFLCVLESWLAEEKEVGKLIKLISGELDAHEEGFEKSLCFQESNQRGANRRRKRRGYRP